MPNKWKNNQETSPKWNSIRNNLLSVDDSSTQTLDCYLLVPRTIPVWQSTIAILLKKVYWRWRRSKHCVYVKQCVSYRVLLWTEDETSLVSARPRRLSSFFHCFLIILSTSLYLIFLWLPASLMDAFSHGHKFLFNYKKIHSHNSCTFELRNDSIQ